VSRKKTGSSRTRTATPENFAQAIEALKCGDLIVFPTETLYGLGADALNENAVERVFALKGRDPGKPISVLIGNRNMLSVLVQEIPPQALKLIHEFWPGPLTLVLPARKDIPKPLISRSGGIGIRISSHPVATQIVQALGRPLTATSANPSGREPARSLAEARHYFQDRVTVYVDGGVLTSKNGSTVIEVTGRSIKIVREGEIPASDIERTLEREECIP